MPLGNWLRDRLWRDDSDYREGEMSCPQMTFVGVDPAFYARLLAQAKSAGVEFNADGTQASIDGCVFNWNYDAAAKTLYVTCIKKPFLIGCDALRDRVPELIAHARSVNF